MVVQEGDDRSSDCFGSYTWVSTLISIEKFGRTYGISVTAKSGDDVWYSKLTKDHELFYNLHGLK